MGADAGDEQTTLVRLSRRRSLLFGSGALALVQLFHLVDELRYDRSATFPGVLFNPLGLLGVGVAAVGCIAVAARARHARRLVRFAGYAVCIGFLFRHAIPFHLGIANNPYWTHHGMGADFIRWTTVIVIVGLSAWLARVASPRTVAAAHASSLQRLREFLRDRIALLRLLGAIPSRALVALTVSMLITSLIPAAAALAVAWLVARAIHASRHQTGLGETIWPLVVVGSLLTFDQVTQSMIKPFRDWTAARVNGAIRRRVRGAVSIRPGVDHLELQTVRDAATMPIDNAYLFNLGAGAEGQLWLLTRFVGAIAAALVVARYSIVAAITAFAFVAWQRAVLRRHYAKAIAGAMTSTINDGRAASYWSEVLGTASGAKELRLFGFQNWALTAFSEHGQVPVNELARVLLGAYSLHWTVFALNACSGFFPMLLLAQRAVDGAMTAAQLTAALGGVVAIARVLSAMGWEAFSIEASTPQLAALERLDRFHTEEAAAAPKRTVQVVGVSAPTIQFESVSFSYPGTDRAIFTGLDLALQPGQSIAIVGENGAGKTTLLKLLAGFYRPTSGRILVDGLDLSTLDPAAWRRRLSVIFQEFVHFELTAFENVALANPAHPDARGHAQAAAFASGAGQIVADLPNGWDTILSRSYRGGVELSGGQWQRIALARALYGARIGAQVLILDEPTASLDVRAEVELFDQLITHAEGRTAIVVSHRFSTVRRADRIIVLADGNVIEDGSHTSLLRRDGEYARLYNLQAQRFRDDESATSASSSSSEPGL